MSAAKHCASEAPTAKHARLARLPDVARVVDTLKRIKGDGGAEAARYIEDAHQQCQDESWKDGAKSAKSTLDIAWRMLHTGHWAQVDTAWRSCYMAASLIAALAHWEVAADDDNKNAVAASCLKSIDLGLMLGDTSYREMLLRAADRFEEHVTPVSSVSSSSHIAAPSHLPLRPLSGTLPALPSLRLPSLAFFHNECMSAAQPAVLTGLIDAWPARTTRPWSDLSYLKRVAGHRTVPVEFGAHYLDCGFDERLMTLREFIEEHLEVHTPSSAPGGRPRAYLAQHQLFEQLPKLRRDVITPDYCMLSIDDDDDEEEHDEGSSVRVNAWLGPGGTLSPLHYDRYHNLLCQVVGSKYIRLYAPEHGEALYPHPEGPHQVSSRIIDPDDTDSGEFPRFADAPYVDLVLAAGECLYIPPRWWHFIESREVSFSVSFWWA